MQNINTNKNYNVLSKNFFFLLIANTISSLGDYIYDVGIVVYLYKITGSPMIIGGFFIFQFIPSLIFTPIIGALIDRWNKKKILIFANVFRSVLVCILFFNISAQSIYLVSAVIGIGDELVRATKNAIIPQLIKNDELIRANSILSAFDSITMIIGPVIASALILSAGINGSIAINVISFLITAIFMVFIKVGQLNTSSSKKDFVKEIKEGLLVIISNKAIKPIIIIWSLLLTGIGATGSLIIILLSDYMKLPTNSYGWIMTAEGVGLVIGSIIIIKKINNSSCINIVKYGLFAISTGLLITTFTSNLSLVLIAYCITGLGAAAAPIGIRTIIQTEVPTELLGRVFISIRFIVTTFRTLSIIVGSILATYINLRIIFFVCAILILFASFMTSIIKKHQLI